MSIGIRIVHRIAKEYNTIENRNGGFNARSCRFYQPSVTIETLALAVAPSPKSIAATPLWQ